MKGNKNIYHTGVIVAFESNKVRLDTIRGETVIFDVSEVLESKLLKVSIDENRKDNQYR